jgi:hypothetical protein
MVNKKKNNTAKGKLKNKNKFNKNSLAGRITFTEFKNNLNFKWVFSGLLMAFLIYGFCFSSINPNFVLTLGIGSVILAVWAVWAGGGLPLFWHNIGNKNIWIGVGSSFVLYLIFVIISFIMQTIFDFVSPEIAYVYNLAEGFSPLLLGGTLLIITGPCLEIFWRGLVQSWAEKVMGRLGAVFFTAFCYTMVFVFTLNISLIFAALVCGLYWGFLYMWRQSLAVCVFSHSLWLLAVLVMYPLAII